MTLVEGVKKSFGSKGMRLLLMLVSLGIVATLFRMFKGLGAATNLSDDIPWGLWVAVDVFSGVALAAGGFTITAAVYIFNMKKYKPITRPAILTAFIGYSSGCSGLAIDIGKPFSAWHPILMWNPHSVMFEVVMCITLYTTVLLFEFAPAFLERVKWQKTLDILKKFTYPLVIAGIVLSFLHQSSLGGFFLIAPAKLSHLWWSPNLPYLFYLSAIAAGLAMVAFEGIVSTRGLKRESEMDITQGLGRGARITLVLYLVAKVADMTYQGNWPLLFAGNQGQLLLERGDTDRSDHSDPALFREVRPGVRDGPAHGIVLCPCGSDLQPVQRELLHPGWLRDPLFSGDLGGPCDTRTPLCHCHVLPTGGDAPAGIPRRAVEPIGL